MKSLLKAFGAVALVAIALPAFADDTKDAKDLKKTLQDQGINYVQTAQKGVVLSGYVDTSYTYQFTGSGYGQGSTAGANTQNALRQFDTNNNNFNVNAVKLALTKALTSDNTWQAGFRIDTIYGSDAKFLNDSAFTTSSTGTASGTNPFALEQAYVNFNIPVGNGLQIAVGKQVTLLGYEVIESPANLNFSRGLLFTNLIPLTSTGVVASYSFNSTVQAKLGIVDGWNNSISPGFNNANGQQTSSFGKAITGQLNINNPGGNANITQSFIASPEGDNAIGTLGNFGRSDFMGVYDIWGNWTPTFVKNSALLLGFNFDLGYNGSAELAGSAPESQTWEGGALYAQYKFSPKFNLAGRAEIIHEDAASDPKFGAAGVDNLDLAETITGTFNIWDNLLTRVEYRIDDLNPGLAGSGATTHAIQNEVSLNAVYSF